MQNWWRTAKLETFEDRNVINEQIVKLKALSDTLKYAAKLVFMTARGARKMVAQIRESKTLSSYDSIVHILSQADKTALDAPGKFALFCNHAAKLLSDRVEELEEERKEFVEKTLPERLKGLRDD